MINQNPNPTPTPPHYFICFFSTDVQDRKTVGSSMWIEKENTCGCSLAASCWMDA